LFSFAYPLGCNVAQETTAAVIPQQLSLEYSNVIANEFLVNLKRYYAALETQFMEVQHISMQLHAENSRLKEKGYENVILEELEFCKGKLNRLERENAILEEQLREKTDILNAIRKHLPQ
jgi:predicted nuclease with TOPRIM domain